jgi:peroxiredoxin
MHKTTIALLAAVTLGLILVGCEAKEEASAEAEPDEAASAATQTPEDEQEESVDEPTKEAPRAKETGTISDEELGTRPEGIGLEVGSEAPDIAVAAADGSGEVDLRELASKQPVLVIFYRGGWCPFCNYQIRQLSTNYEPFEERGVLPVLISVDQMSEASKTEQAYEIPFPVLADPDLKAHEAFDVIYEAEDEEVERLAKMGMDLEAASGRDHHSYAIPSVFLISTDAEILWAHAHLDYSKRPTIEQLVEVLDETL